MSVPIEERLVELFKSEKYRALLARAALTSQKSIPVDFNDLIAFDEELSHKIVDEPLTYLPILSRAAYKQLQIESPEYAAKVTNFYARVHNLPVVTPIREIRSTHLRKLIMVDGIVVRATVVKPMLDVGVFQCRYCGEKYRVPQNNAPRLRQPERCTSPQCRGKRPVFDLIQEESEFVDYQVIGVQEKPEDLPPGQLPRVIEVRLRDDLVDRARPGDRVLITSILLSSQERTGEVPLRTFKSYLDAVWVETVSKEPESLQITPEEEELFKQMAQDPLIYNKIMDSLAPSIYGLEHIKEAIMLLLFGGRNKVFPDGVKVRGDINILLVGDPGMAKSALLQYVANIAPRGLYTSGRGTTAAGLTAAVIREQGGGMVLEAGATVLADMGVCCIDEIDKMKPEDRVALHEVMAQQTVSIAKGGIVATLNARTSILAAANPALGRYDPYMSFTDNVNLPVTLLSRFDLIFVLRDEPNLEQDKKVSSHILALHSTGSPTVAPPIKPEILKKYIAYAKRVNPELTPGALKILEDFYLQMRSVYEKTSTVTITARQLESLIRLAEAKARVALRDKVTEEDAGAVVLLMKRSLQEVGIDVKTGKPDIDVIMTGKPKSVRDKLAIVLNMIKEFEERKGVAEEEELKAALVENGLSEPEINRILSWLITEGKVYTPKPGCYKVA